MKRILLLMVWQFGLLAGSPLFADVVTLKDGRQISGSVESGNIQELHIKVGDRSQTIDIHDVDAIQLGISLPASTAASTPPKAENVAPAAALAAPAQPNILILHDGTHVSGRLWSIDAHNLHFLVNSQLQHYPRTDVTGVTFGNAALPPPPAPAPSTPPPATSSEPPANIAPPARAPTLARSTDGPPPKPPTLKRSSDGPPPAAPPRAVSQPEEIGTVYFWNGKGLYALEHNRAVEHKSRSTDYWEMSGPRSRVRLDEASRLVFILPLQKGVDPADYSLFPLVTVDGGRRTRARTGRNGGLVTWPVDIQINDESGFMTYAITAKDLPTGEYSFSPSGSDDAYCFGIDPSGPGQ